MTDDATGVLDFWLGASRADGALDPAKKKMWFGDGRRYDAEIRGRFGLLHERARRGELTASWPATPRGRLALIIVLDQFSRHIHRDTAAAFAQDAAALALATQGIDLGVDAALIPAGRAFFYLPLEHAEALAVQDLSVACFARLAADVAPAWRADYESFLDYARRHRDVIVRFGRFPHRNAALGRTSSAAEQEYLAAPGAGF